MKKHLKYPVIVEGKYDEIKIDSLYEGTVFKTEGFRLFKNKEKQAFFRKLAKKTKIIVFTDSDGGGLVIRNALKSFVPNERLIQLYIPQVEGKEKRKDAPSKEGFLGVEGTDAKELQRILDPYTLESEEEMKEKEEKGTKTGENGGEPKGPEGRPEKEKEEKEQEEKEPSRKLTYAEFYELGYVGGEGSREKRKNLCKKEELPENISPKSLLEALNLLYSIEELEKIL